MHEVPDEYLADAMPLAKKVAVASGLKYYNILQVKAARIKLYEWKYVVNDFFFFPSRTTASWLTRYSEIG